MFWGVSVCKNFPLLILSGIWFCPKSITFKHFPYFIHFYFLFWIAMEFYSLFRLVYKKGAKNHGCTEFSEICLSVSWANF